MPNRIHLLIVAVSCTLFLISCGGTSGQPKGDRSVPLTDEESVAADLDYLDSLIDDINSSGADDSLNLPTVGPNGSEISWQSDRPDIIGADGTITRPPFPGEDATVTLVATINKGSVTETMTYTVTVAAADPTDAQAVAAAAESVELTDDQDESTFYVYGDLNLATSGEYGTVISWSSDSPGVIANDGTVNRPTAGSPPATVVLTASIEKNGQVVEVDYTLTVLEGNQTPTFIQDLDSLGDMSSDPSAYYVLMQDIDLNDYDPAGTGEGWSGPADFSGTFEGGGHTVSNMTINRPGSYNQGFFATIDAGVVRNLTLEAVDVTGDGAVGALAGLILTDTLIDNVAVSGAVAGSSPQVGGLIGNNNASTIQNSSANVEVVSTSHSSGGLAGANYQGSITNSFATGNVTGVITVGGLIGASTSSGTVTGCYATGAVEATSGGVAGGLIGAVQNLVVSSSYAIGDVTGTGNSVGGLIGVANESTISICYATGDVTSSGTWVGGLIGLHNTSSSITNCYAMGSASGDADVGGLVGVQMSSSTVSHSYATGTVSGSSNTGGLMGRLDSGSVTAGLYDTTTTGQSDNAGKGTPVSTANMKIEATFTGAGWDFVGESLNGTGDHWSIAPGINSGYPYLNQLEP